MVASAMSKREYTLEDARDDVCEIKADVKWLKWCVGLGVAVLIGLHYVDPTVHVWIFQFP